MTTLSVTQLNRYIKAIFDESPQLQDLFILGEIANFTNHYASGHFYFTLKDKKASVRGVMFKGYASQLSFTPQEGMEVLVRASVSLYEATGNYQLYVTDMEPYGVGAMEVALRQLKEKLDKKGYFLPEHKKPLPLFPKIIGVVTSKTGAALGDITQILTRRYPVATLCLAPALVQGKEAPASLVKALNALDGRCDVIIIGRGGGSQEDLWAFNNEALAEAIFYAQTPIISAVGHEMDVTICDLVADHRAPTPSAAAELATPSLVDIAAHLASLSGQLSQGGLQLISILNKIVTDKMEHPLLKNPLLYVGIKEKELEFLSKTLYNIQNEQFKAWGSQLEEKAALLDSLSPFAVLGRGYTAVFKGEVPIRSVKELQKNQALLLKFYDGVAGVTVNSIKEDLHD